MTNQAHPSDRSGQRRRWIKYGLNVAVLVIATIAIVVLVNWVAYRRYVRFDFTHTRQYTLSPQTLSLLNSLDQPIQITTFYDSRSVVPELRQRVDDLIAEYERRSSTITVRQIDPATDVQEREAFLASLLSQHASAAKANQKAIGDAQQVLATARKFVSGQSGRLTDVMAEANNADPEIVLFLRQLSQIFQAADQTLKQASERVQRQLAEPLPDYEAARQRLATVYNNLSDNILEPAAAQFSLAVDSPNTPDALKDALLGLRSEYQQMQASLRSTAQALSEVESGEYDEIRRKLQQANSIVITTGPVTDTVSGAEAGEDVAHGVVVLTLDDIYPNLILASVAPDQIRPEQGYKGEEAITGAILRLTLKHDTKVVFINPYPRSLLRPSIGGQGGMSFTTVADRLRKMNFEVEEWQPGGTRDQFGRMQPQPRPVARPGQTMVFVVLPPPPLNPQNPSAATGPAVAQALREHLDAGQPALVFTAPSAMANVMSQEDPLVAALKDWGITVDAARVILTAQPSPNGTPQPSNQIRLADWPESHPVAKAVKGLTGALLQASPLNLPAQPPEGVEHWPLARTDADTWAESDVQIGQAKMDESDPRGPFTVAAAARRGDQRLVAIADVTWASNTIADAGPRQPIVTGGSVEVVTLYHSFPANPELFVNSVYWLSGLEPLIAPGARTQEIRRIDAISPGAMLAVWWFVLAGLPLATLGAGGVVWFVRRR